MTCVMNAQTHGPSPNLTVNTANNRVTDTGYAYDAAGNVTNDGFHTYTWDADANMRTVDSTSVTFDALDRPVEKAVGTTYTQFVYSPMGGKLALMNGQTLSKAFVPLPGGGAAVYTSGPTLSYYRHPDWLGSSRFASTPTRGMYYDGAYAPYGENYAETGTTDRNFTGQNQDTVSSGSYPLYDFLYREHHPVWGRWLSPDPAGLGAVDPSDPQTWNQYGYVRNSPLNFVDPLGLKLPVQYACYDPAGMCAGNATVFAGGGDFVSLAEITGVVGDFTVFGLAAAFPDNCNGDPTGCGGGGVPIWVWAAMISAGAVGACPAGWICTTSKAPTPTAPGSQPSGLSNLPGCFTVFATETAVQWVSPSLSLATIGQVANEAAPYVRAATVIKGMEIKGTPVLASGAAKTAGRVARAARAGRWFRFGVVS